MMGETPLKRIIAALLSLLLALQFAPMAQAAPFHQGAPEAVAPGLAAPEGTGDPSSAAAALDELAAELFVYEASYSTDTLNLMVAHPEKYGIERFDPTLGDPCDPQALKGQTKYYHTLLLRLEGIDYAALPSSGQVTYDVLADSLGLWVEYANFTYHQEPLAPAMGLHVQLPLTFTEYHFRTVQDIEDYLALLEDAPRYLEQVAQFERDKASRGLFMNASALDTVIGECEDLIDDEAADNFLVRFFDELLTGDDPLFANLDESTKETYRTRNLQAVGQQFIPAYQNLISTLTSLEESTHQGGVSSYPRGQAYYSLLMRTEGFSRTPSDALDLLTTRIDEGFGEMLDLPYTSLPERDESPEEVLAYLEGILGTEFPELGAVNYTVKEISEELGNDVVMAYYLMPPVDEPDNNIIRVNPDNIPPSELFTTLAHEGFPGHLYQTVYFSRSNPTPIRQAVGYSGYSEGYAMYVEEYAMGLEGLSEDGLRFAKLMNETDYYLYAAVDIGVNYQGWSSAQTESYLAQWGLESMGQPLYENALEVPAVYLDYGLGLLEFLELRGSAETALGGSFDPLAFHTFILDLGPVPFGILTARFDEWLEEQG
jgi:uncharacterized protein (DUF885 family)